MEEVEYERLSNPAKSRTLAVCGCPEKDCCALEVAILEGMDQPTIERSLLYCILCGSMYRKEIPAGN